MDIIITGATGFVGSEVVRQAIANDKVKHAFVLTRKPPAKELADSPKITVIEHGDFSQYPPEILQQLAAADACIWAIGGRAPQFPDVETARKVSVEYTVAFVNAYLAQIAPHRPAGQERFRFLFCSGKFAEWDQEKHLRFMADTRHIKGEVEKALCDLADANEDKLEVFIARPAGIMAPGGRLREVSANLVGFIGVDKLAKAMLNVIIQGHPTRVLDEKALMAKAHDEGK
ncbi:hypothetical protein F4778DRAFT_745313 [Xylariomycetidae sp. FL2044]|nr:hypothetical protein F4778DRAFT_745313 [Xylariomycetidae sp. FL2044]